MDQTHYPFVLPPLPYDYDALQPELDAKTLYFHHDKHFAAYVEKLNDLLAPYPAYQGWTLEKLCLDWQKLPEKIRQDVRNNAGGVYNHDLYFKTLHPLPVTMPGAALMKAIYRDYGSLTQLKAALKAAALGHFGSGWAWLVTDKTGRLSVGSTANQNTPLPFLPLLCCDMWEHAHYLQYQNRREEYFENWWRLIDWPPLSQWYEATFARQ